MFAGGTIQRIAAERNRKAPEKTKSFRRKQVPEQVQSCFFKIFFNYFLFFLIKSPLVRNNGFYGFYSKIPENKPFYKVFLAFAKFQKPAGYIRLMGMKRPGYRKKTKPETGPGGEINETNNIMNE